MSCACKNKISSSDYVKMLALAKKTALLERGDIVLAKLSNGCYKIYRPSQWPGEVFKTVKFNQKSGKIRVV